MGDLDAAPLASRFTQKALLVERLRGAIAENPTRSELHEAANRLSGCGTRIARRDAPVVLRSTGKGRHLAGVQHCNRVLCPACAHFLANQRREVLLARVVAVAAMGRHFHAVFTVRHRRGVKWGELRDAVKATWRAMVSHRTWKANVLGFVRADETTYSEKNGHHFHIHGLLTLAPGVDAEVFKQWIEGFWKRTVREQGRTCEWTEGWWSEVFPAELGRVVRYGTKAAAAEASQVAGKVLGDKVAGEVLGGASKGDSAPWNMPPLAFAEVWRESRNHRWFSTGGVWRTVASEAMESDEAAGAVRETLGAALVTIPPEVWRLVFRSEERRWCAGLVSNRALSDATVCAQLVWFAASRGVQLALPGGGTAGDAPPQLAA